jgi:2-dehydro-3-deoxygluconokinase
VGERGAEFDVVSLGESLGLLVAAQTGPLQHVDAMRLRFGGAESNVAIGVSRLGGRAGWIGRLGADSFGALIARELRAEGVAVHATIDAEAATALMLKERPGAGRSRITYYRRHQSGSRLAPGDLPVDVIEGARVLHVTGISAGLGESPLRTVHAAIDRAEAAGTAVSFDVNHRSSLWGDDTAARDAYRGIAERADAIFAGDDEAELLTGESDPQRQAEELLALGAAHAVVKLGERGALALSRTDAGVDRAEREAIPVPVVDTVGAGDAFVAGWLTRWASGADLSERMDAAVACGAFACTVEGDWEGAPTPADLRDLTSGGGDPVSR